MDTAQFLKIIANAYMSATLAKRVTVDVVRSSPYQAAGAAALIGMLAGVAITVASRAHRSNSRLKSPGGFKPKAARS
jgi:hypothetical protein